MESEDALKYYLEEVKDTQHDINHIEEEIHIPNEAEQATDFLQNAGLGDLSKLYQQGKEITENVIKNSVHQRNLSEKQAQTIRSRVRILNQTLRSRQPRRKQRQDIRDISWNAETSSTGTRSRSATPDSLDSLDNLNDEITYDDQNLTSLSPFSLDLQDTGGKKKIKSTNSEPWQNKKFYRNDRGDVAHTGSENVVLKGYQALSENGTSPRPPRERSGSDPTTEIHFQPLKQRNSADSVRPTQNDHHKPLFRSHTSVTKNNTKVYLNSNETNEIEAVSFEGMLKNDNDTNAVIIEKWDNEGISIDQLSDSEYQYLKPLLYMELVAIFDTYKIVTTYLKRKASKNKGGNVFGVNLSTLVMRDMPRPTDHSMVPEIFHDIIDNLNTRCIKEDGILRLASQKQKLEILCNDIETKFYSSNRKEVEQLLKQAPVHELTGVLKKLLRDLPEPVFTMELFEMFYKTSNIANTEMKLKALNLLVLMLPIEHRNTYRLLLKFFQNIINNEKYNRMNLHNVAMISAPSLFPPRLLLPNKTALKQLSKEEMTKQIQDAAVCCILMEVMLTAGDQLWIVPGYLADQAREAQKRAQDRRDLSKDKDKRIRSGKNKPVRSNTHYEASVMNIPRMKRDFYV
ncbi:rho GTPase-activating protein conundrum-like isoform X1 [Diabrotica virgifera virgifera]|uniref:Rho GTPase-activating protein conundrum-like isoform X1 n=1 Tax=Diabrotica virgifera virgifera TaxID=50390 RepID=A0A6P7GG94_DIAVI|nr:rho GTPase-activating protein conundrum-like isoform X1 [Diabrotica virgifera virgifera]